MKASSLLSLTFILWQCAAINVYDISLFNCTSGSECGDDAVNTDDGVEIKLDSTPMTNVWSEENDIKRPTTDSPVDVDSTTTDEKIIEKQSPVSTLPTAVSTMTIVQPATSSNTENNSEICTCDVPLCDVLCCCENGCNGTRLSVFFNYGYDRTNIYDDRCCYTKNSMHRNRTRFSLRKLASNLFCIAYDNRAPTYGIKDSPDLTDEKSIGDRKNGKDRNKYLWEWKNFESPSELNISRPYRNADNLWKFQNEMVTLIELPQSGFTGECKLIKTVNYLETSEWRCMQTELSNDNPYLFREAYDDFMVISSPHLFNSSYIMAENHTCPNNVCVPVQSLFCSESWSVCNTTELPEQSCFNGDCQNVVNRIRYTVVTDVILGITSIQVHFQLTNTTRNFYQYFEVIFLRSNEKTGLDAFSRRAAYAIGNPLIVGRLEKKIVNNVTTESITVGQSNYYLTVPLKERNGDCDSRERYVVGFGEDVRLRCRVKLAIDGFSSDPCLDLRNLTLKHMFGGSLHNMSEFEKFNRFVTKTGDITKNKSSDWTAMLINGISENVITGHIYNDRISCWGLSTTLKIDVSYTVYPKPENPAYKYEIAGVSVTLLEPIDVSWPKCHSPNCRNVLQISLLSIVSFTDISSPSMYRYASRPNLDITLPYDFFYPFMSSGNHAGPPSLFIHLIIIFITSNVINYE